MPDEAIRVAGKWYFYAGTYRTWKKAKRIGEYYKKKEGSKYWIQKSQYGWIFPKTGYHLYLNNIKRL